MLLFYFKQSHRNFILHLSFTLYLWYKWITTEMQILYATSLVTQHRQLHGNLTGYIYYEVYNAWNLRFPDDLSLSKRWTKIKDITNLSKWHIRYKGLNFNQIVWDFCCPYRGTNMCSGDWIRQNYPQVMKQSKAKYCFEEMEWFNQF